MVFIDYLDSTNCYITYYHVDMRLLIVSALLPSLGTSAGAARVFEVVRGASRRHAVDVLTFIDSDDDLRHLPALQAICRSVTTILRRRAPNAGDLFGIQPRQFVTEYSDPTMAAEICRRVSSGAYDLVQFEFLQAAWLMPRACPIPSILTHLEVQHPGHLQRLRLASSASERVRHFITWMRVLHWELEICSRFRKVITLTPDDATHLARFLPNTSISVNRSGVDCTYYTPRLTEIVSNRFVFVGYYGHTPNVDAATWLVSMIMPMVWRTHPNVALDIVGGGVTPTVRALGADPRVTVTGWVEDYRPLVARAIPLVPVRLGHGIRHKVLEAWAMGRPVVSTKLGVAGTGAVDGETASIADSAPAFASAIVNLIDSPVTQATLGRNGRARAVAHFDWSVTLAEHESIYTSVMREWRTGVRRP